MADVPPGTHGGQPTEPTAEQAAGGAPGGGGHTPPWGSPPYAPQGAGVPSWVPGEPAAPGQGGPPGGYVPPGPGAYPHAAPPGAPSGGWGGPPWGGPPWGAPGWGPWYGWGPAGPTGPWQAPPAAPPRPPSVFRRPDGRWAVVGAVLATLALVGLGIVIGFSVWGGTTSAPASSSRPGHLRPASPFSGTSGSQAFLGVAVAPVAAPTGTSTATPGAHVVRVVAGSPAAKAGIVSGDTITMFGTQKVGSDLTLAFDVQHDSPGQKVKVGWVTAAGKHESASVKLASRSASSAIG
jgi:hypothetical protein